ncbi:eryA [Symbiodinium microadriaticum]|nr:eryA [Symbiodinium microadriaticum]
MADPFSSQKFGEGGSAGGRTPGGAGSGGPDPRAVAGSRLRGWAAGDRGQIRAADVGGRWRAPSRRARAGAAVCGCTRQRGSRIAARLPDVPEHHGQGPGPGPAVRRGAAQQSLGPAALLGVVSPLHADDTLEIMADQMQLDEMDNEIFEPLNQFDDDLKDLMIDCITEKVRRILSLDPSKYKNGRLPFGLKPHKGIAFADDETDLEAELERMRELYERLKEENEQLLRQLEAARAAAERWKQKYLELQNKPAEVQEEKVVVSRPASVKTTPETPKEREATPPPVIKGLSDEEVKRLLEEQEKAYKAKIAALEKRIKQLEDELAKLKAEKDKADAKAKEAAETAQKERERRETLQKEQEQASKEPPAGSDDATSSEGH